MATTKAINVELGAKQRALVERQLESGRYSSPREVINDALQLMARRDAIFDDWLRQDVQAALGDKRKPVPLDTVFDRLEVRHAKRVKAAKRGA